MSARPTFDTRTPERLRSLRLLTLAAMVHLEAQGVSMTGRSAKRQAFEALDLTGTSAGVNHLTAADLIHGLRDLAGIVKTPEAGR